MKLFYLDTSAAMKLLRRENETEALVRWQRSMTGQDYQIVSSDLIRTELMLAATRYGVDATEVRRFIQALTLLRVTSALCEAAGRLAGLGVRSLDAVHLASALSLTDALDSLITYDEQLANASRKLGVATLSPH